jgi:hypothetical protein
MTVDGPSSRAQRIGNNRPRPSELLTVEDAGSRLGVPGRCIRQLIVERRSEVPETLPVDVTRALTPEPPPYGRSAAAAMSADAARENDTGPQLNLEDLASLPPTLDLMTAAQILGIGRTAAYALVRAGRWPTPVIRAGRLIRVPTAPLLQLLGLHA